MDAALNMALLLLSSVSQLILLSLGLAVVYGLMQVINFAHGEFFMLGAYVVLVLSRIDVHFAITVIAAPIVVGLIGLIVERLLIRHLYGRIIDSMLVTFGVSLVFQQMIANWFGYAPVGMTPISGHITIGAYQFGLYRIIMVVLTVLVVGTVWLVFTRTAYGIRARAASQAPEVAEAVGINASRLNMITFAFGCALAGLAGALFSPLISVEPYMGAKFLAGVFMTVIVGGTAVISGTALASAILASVQNFGEVFTTPFIAQAVMLLAAIVLVRLRPRGLSQNWKSRL